MINQGLLFRKKIAWDNIASVDYSDERMSSGIYASVRKPRVVATSRRKNLISIQMKEKERFGYALGKLADEIIIDVNDTERFISEAKKKMTMEEPTS